MDWLYFLYRKFGLVLKLVFFSSLNIMSSQAPSKKEQVAPLRQQGASSVFLNDKPMWTYVWSCGRRISIFWPQQRQPPYCFRFMLSVSFPFTWFLIYLFGLFEDAKRLFEGGVFLGKLLFLGLNPMEVGLHFGKLSRPFWLLRLDAVLQLGEHALLWKSNEGKKSCHKRAAAERRLNLPFARGRSCICWSALAKLPRPRWPRRRRSSCSTLRRRRQSCYYSSPSPPWFVWWSPPPKRCGPCWRRLPLAPPGSSAGAGPSQRSRYHSWPWQWHQTNPRINSSKKQHWKNKHSRTQKIPLKQTTNYDSIHYLLSGIHFARRHKCRQFAAFFCNTSHCSRLTVS